MGRTIQRNRQPLPFQVRFSLFRLLAWLFCAFGIGFEAVLERICPKKVAFENVDVQAKLIELGLGSMPEAVQPPSNAVRHCLS